ncbi:hypothetical protein QFC20_002740 [Naganishia adeliensis]|uniref:Uncharacterized protein n=1 Tax=Naganishia adeliensis TaxID=92952 RepID=A0ACC2WHV5_9TREE|nr:hypothetical protein QFC20_002740 [Naganishia adeliensis]
MSAENELKCNNLKCRKELASDGRAVVTNCSLPCAEILFKPDRLCPACEIQLTEADDIVDSLPINRFALSLQQQTTSRRTFTERYHGDCNESDELLDVSDISGEFVPDYGFEECERAIDGCGKADEHESVKPIIGYPVQRVLKSASLRKQSTKNSEISRTDHSYASTGANMKNASLITEVEDLNRKVREMLEQVREKDRQISKLQGNYSKLQKKHLLGGSAAAIANAVNDEVQHSLANSTYASHMARYQGNNAALDGPKTLPFIDTIRYPPQNQVQQRHQPQNQHQPQHQRQNQLQNQLQNQNINQAYRNVTPDDPVTERRQQRGSAETQVIQGRYSYPNGTVHDGRLQQTSRQPSISPEQRALITGMPTPQRHSSRQPLAAMTGEANQNVSIRTPMLGNSKSHTEMRALNDSGFGMKAPMSLKKTPGNQPQRASHMQAAGNQNLERRGPENRPRVPTENGGNYGDRLMALQGRVPQGRSSNGESSLRSELPEAIESIDGMFGCSCILVNASTGNVQPRMSM